MLHYCEQVTLPLECEATEMHCKMLFIQVTYANGFSFDTFRAVFHSLHCRSQRFSPQQPSLPAERSCFPAHFS